MISWLLPLVIGIILFFFTLGVVGISIYIVREGKRVKVEPNAPIIDTTMRKEFLDGHSLGIVKIMRQNKNGTKYIELYPLDKRQGIGEEMPKLYPLVVSDEMLDIQPRGDQSDYRERIKVLPRSNADLPKKMRLNDLDLEAKNDVEKGQVAHLTKILKPTLITHGDEAIVKMLKTLTRTGISAETVTQLMEENAQFRKASNRLVNSPKEEEKK